MSPLIPLAALLAIAWFADRRRMYFQGWDDRARHNACQIPGRVAAQDAKPQPRSQRR